MMSDSEDALPDFGMGETPSQKEEYDETPSNRSHPEITMPTRGVPSKLIQYDKRELPSKPQEEPSFSPQEQSGVPQKAQNEEAPSQRPFQTPQKASLTPEEEYQDNKSKRPGTNDDPKIPPSISQVPNQAPKPSDSQENPSLRKIPTPQIASSKPQEKDPHDAPSYKPYNETPTPLKGVPSQLLDYEKEETPSQKEEYEETPSNRFHPDITMPTRGVPSKLIQHEKRELPSKPQEEPSFSPQEPSGIPQREPNEEAPSLRPIQTPQKVSLTPEEQYQENKSTRPGTNDDLKIPPSISRAPNQAPKPLESEEVPSLRKIPTPQIAPSKPQDEDHQDVPSYKPYNETPTPTKGVPSKLLEHEARNVPTEDSKPPTQNLNEGTIPENLSFSPDNDGQHAPFLKPNQTVPETEDDEFLPSRIKELPQTKEEEETPVLRPFKTPQKDNTDDIPAMRTPSVPFSSEFKEISPIKNLGMASFIFLLQQSWFCFIPIIYYSKTDKARVPGPHWFV